MQYETKVLTTKYQKPDAYGALSMPVYYTAAFEFPDAKAMSDAFCGRSMAPSYARIANPTVTYLEERVRQITGAQQLPEIKRVNYTGLENNPFHALSEAQFGPLPGAVFTIDLESKEAAWAFIDQLQIIRRATNLFDRKSLAIHPASTIFGLFTPKQCAEMSVLDTTIRLSIGLEAGEDLLEDIMQALV